MVRSADAAQEWGMSFAWRRIRRHVASHGLPPRDPREARAALGHFADAPAFRDAPAGFRVCPHDWSTVHGAAALGLVRILKRLLRAGESVDARDRLGRTALAWAVEDGRRPAVELLLARGADPAAPDEAGSTPLHLAVRRGDAELLGLLLQSVDDPDVGKGLARTPLMDAVAGRNLSAVNLLLRRGADPKAVDRHGQDVLFHVDSAGAVLLLPGLLDAGAVIGTRNRDGDTCRHVALRKGDVRLWEALTPEEDASDWVEERGRVDDSPLHAAVEGGCLPAIRRLVARGADPNAVNRFGHTPLLVALTAENLAATALLVELGAKTGFLEAVAAGDAERASELVPAPGVRLDAPVMGLETPLMGAVARGRVDLAALLRSRGASLDMGSAVIGTPLDVAALTGQAALVRWLLEEGADPALARRVRPELLHAMAWGEEEGLPPLPPLGSHRPDASEIVAAAVCGDDSGLTFLRLCGADIDLPDPDGTTALMQAVEHGDSGAIRRLLAFGADPDRRDLSGRSARDRARDLGRELG